MQGVARALAGGVTALLLTACATPPAAPPERSYAGRFAAVATRGTDAQSVSGRFNLEVRGSEQTLDLASPLGTTVARIEIGPSGARARGPQLDELRGSNADELAERLLGWPLPVAGLSDWIEARPVPGRPAQIERTANQVTSIAQDGWTIRFTEFFAAGGQPRRLVLERPAAGTQPAVTVRLIVDDPG